MSALRIALVGAESTGKTTLARELATHFQRNGRTAIVAAEVLREQAAQKGARLALDDYEGIAREQERRVDAASSQAQVTIADTTAVMVAIYGGLLFDDHPLVRFAAERQRAYDVTLVTGLDLPWVDDGLHRDAASREAVDTQVRDFLARSNVAYRVVYGSGPERLRNALAAIDASLAPRTAASWAWPCDKCSDPGCEHRLFTALLSRS